MRTDEFAQMVNRMTNHQRNLWARAGYPGLHQRDVEKLWKFVPPPLVKRKTRAQWRLSGRMAGALAWAGAFGALALIGLTSCAALADEAPLLPDPKLTPGDTRPGVMASDLCPIAHTAAVRNVTADEKKAVYAEYGIQPHKGYCAPKGCEIDHLVSLELAGSNDIKNLWPQSYSGIWSARTKDHYENFLHAEVCDGKMTLQEAQKEISTDWIAGYKKHPELPDPTGATLIVPAH